MSTEKIGFKTRLFGGFDRNDVAVSIERIANERNSYKERAAQLEEQVDALTAELSRVREDAAQAIQTAAEAADRAEKAHAAAIEKATSALCALNARYQDISSDLSAAIQATQAQLDMVRSQLDLLWEKVSETGSTLGTLASAGSVSQSTPLFPDAASSPDSAAAENPQASCACKAEAGAAGAVPADEPAQPAPTSPQTLCAEVPDAVKKALNDLGLNLESLLDLSAMVNNNAPQAPEE